jgi:hypothetical protein
MVQEGEWVMRSTAIEALKEGLKLSTIQREILVGILLGDATLESQNRGRTYRLKIEQSVRHHAYVMHLYKIFQEWVLTAPKEKRRRRNGKPTNSVAFSTVSHAAFRFYGHQFYRDQKKCVPRLVHRWLTPRALSYWYMDDGSIKSKESKGMILNTQGFPRSEVDRLCEALSTVHQLQVTPRRQKDGWQIYVSGQSYDTMAGLIEPHLVATMRYKMPPPRRTPLPKE